MTVELEMAAVVLMTRKGFVLGLTRGMVDHDIHLPGGKHIPRDGYLADGAPDLARTAARELFEEVDITVDHADLRSVVRYRARTGLDVEAFQIVAPDDAPERFLGYDGRREGRPGWWPPEALVQRWCSLAPECRTILEAAGVLRRRRPRVVNVRRADATEPAAPRVRLVCPDCDRRLECAVESSGARFPLHKKYPDDPLSTHICTFSFAAVARSGRMIIDDADSARLLLEVAEESMASAQLAHGLARLGARA